MSRATAVLEQLIQRMGDGSGPVESVIGQWSAGDVPVEAAAIPEGAPWAMAMSVVEELGESWGATGDPTWVDGLVPGRGGESPDIDYMFALYRRPRIYAYARLRGDDGDPPRHMRMILGVIRKPVDHGD